MKERIETVKQKFQESKPSISTKVTLTFLKLKNLCCAEKFCF